MIVDYLNRGVSVAEIAARIDVGEKRMRAIIREILARRMPAPPEDFVAIQLSRLNEALLVAYSAMSRDQPQGGRPGGQDRARARPLSRILPAQDAAGPSRAKSKTVPPRSTPPARTPATPGL